ncbi:MAG: hypothetical protein AB7F25_10230 [Deferribacterales bacterium]
MAEKEKVTTVEVKCPLCDHTQIVYIPKEEIPLCPIHKKKMIIKELLEEGKSC